ncbi:hypothetical protein AAFC00_002107 [Neodothiora populina]|uniref:Sde2 N-terminal ubiquitin domain-containing protein n=1 Tax=Neodothiora populina TaxID=2781224 RepID=A0ABR3PGA8_9PEZI
MASTNIINVFFSTFQGLGLPRTLCIPTPDTSRISDLLADLDSRISTTASLPFSITTPSRRSLDRDSQETIASLLDRSRIDKLHNDAASPILNLRLLVPTLGGKGGFGSQLRAAGGRMSSRKNRRNPEQQNASNRNLDGRRLRTITEAKNLAAYLAMKPDMDKKEREERRKRWEAVVEAADRKEEEVKRGKGPNVRLDGQWVEQKEELEGKTRDAVLAAMKAGLIANEAIIASERTGSESSASDQDDGADSDDPMDPAASGASSSAASGADEKAATSSKPSIPSAAPRTFFGWDEDDEDMSDEDEGDEDEVQEQPAPLVTAYGGKGKAPA